MAEIDNTIALKGQTPNFLNTMGNIMNVANTAQQIKRGNIAQEGEQMTLDERKGLQQVLSNPDKYTDETGTPNYDSLIKDIMKAAPTTGPEYITKIIQGHIERTKSQSAFNQLGAEQKALVGQYFLPLANSSPEEAKKGFDDFAKENPSLAPISDFVWKKRIEPNVGNPKAFKDAVIKFAQGTMPVASQVAATTPTYQPTGGSLEQINPMAASAGAQKSMPMTLPPTTPTFNPETNAPGYLGTAPPNDGIAGGRSRPAPRPIQSGPALGVAGNIGGTVETVNKHFQTTTGESDKAAQDISVLQNIKKYAPGAVTGVGSDRRSFAAGLAGLLGMSEEQLSKTNTDLLAKESNMLALAGGDTNLAKTLAESANPNTHMTPEAITKAADRVISMKEMAIEKQKYFQNIKNDSGQYANGIAEWNSHADPRVMQWPHMSKDEKVEMRKAMSLREAQKFSENLRWFEGKGILK